MKVDFSVPWKTAFRTLDKFKENPVSYGIIPVFIFLLAFIPRVVDLGTGLTIDEPNWLHRAPQFTDALFRGDYAGTYTTSHPGVTVMWLSGIFMQLFLRHGMDFPQYLSVARFPVVLVTSFGIVLMFFLMRGLVPEKTAILASVLIAMDPFYLAHSRFIHLDALLTTFMVLTLLSFLIWIRQPHKSGFMVLAGGFLGLALLTKQPAESLIPFFLLALVIWQFIVSYNSVRNLKKACRVCFSIPFFRSVLQPFLTILVIAGILCVLFWPAMWVAPVNTVQKMEAGLENVVENPHEAVGYFLGVVTTTGNYGPLFYPVVLLMKLTPITLVFSLVGIFGFLYLFRKSKFSDENLTVLFILFFIALFFLLMTISGKKGDRYLLPVFPCIDLLAAIGICSCYSFVSGRIYGSGNRKFTGMPGIVNGNRWYGAVVILIVVLEAVLIVPIAPYYLSYSNPVVLGGPHDAPKYLLVGWGEGQDLAAAYLNNKSGAEHLKVFAQYEGFEQYFKGKRTNDLASADYIVFYSCAVQRHYNAKVWDYYKGKTPEKVIILNTIEYCWIYPTSPR